MTKERKGIREEEEKGKRDRQLATGTRRWDALSLRLIYSRDQGEVPSFLRRLIRSIPEEIVQPTSIEEVQEVFRKAYAQRVPVTPSAGRSFALGGAIPTKGGISLDLSFLNHIVEVNPEEKWVLVEAGVRWNSLADELKKYALALCTDPSSWFSTVGGWVNTGGYGIGSLKFGNLMENVIGLKVVTPQGELWKVVPGMPQFEPFFNSEGQLGAITQVRLKVRKLPTSTFPLLFSFESDTLALDAIQALLSAGLRPFYLLFLDREKMKEMNALMKTPLLPEKPCVFVVAESEEEKEMITSWDRGKATGDRKLETGNWKQEAEYLAEYLWHERFFPLKAKKLGPGLLASDVVMPVPKVLSYIQRCRKLGRAYGISVSVEAHYTTPTTALVLPTFLTDSRRSFLYLLHSALAYQMAEAGIRMGGKPYGIGLWYKRFLKGKWRREVELKWRVREEWKRRLDPLGLCNPEKSLGRGFAPPGVPFFLRPILALLSRMLCRARAHPTPKKTTSPRNEVFSSPSPLPSADRIGIPTPVSDRGKGEYTALAWTGYRESNPLWHSIYACSSCGACYAKCPAYLVTRDERTTARGKLQLSAEILLKNNKKITAEEAQTMFLCMHCGFCTEVCQSELDLEATWNLLEGELEKRYGKPVKRIEEFVKEVEESGVMPATRP